MSNTMSEEARGLWEHITKCVFEQYKELMSHMKSACDVSEVRAAFNNPDNEINPDDEGACMGEDDKWEHCKVCKKNGKTFILYGDGEDGSGYLEQVMVTYHTCDGEWECDGANPYTD